MNTPTTTSAAESATATATTVFDDDAGAGADPSGVGAIVALPENSSGSKGKVFGSPRHRNWANSGCRATASSWSNSGCCTAVGPSTATVANACSTNMVAVVTFASRAPKKAGLNAAGFQFGSTPGGNGTVVPRSPRAATAAFGTWDTAHCTVPLGFHGVLHHGAVDSGSCS
eukprot:CAMPEP_0174833090 /NCGR_PEP_ID=MMETSP1114-20130205/4026_1 /TAXON_ID=312471 /ORGANISM="Neobodo designis, Strain CCAP 1951/1" /LENGTH=170 /DNA_ID=CAMNT_0016066961 /DNA_START=153 /DNA_END=662 /DNA_ORIENTATION=+